MPTIRRTTTALLGLACTGGACAPSPGEEIPTRAFEPEPIRVTLDDLPEPFATRSASQPPRVVDPPRDPVLEVPEGFRINVYADVPSARWLALTPEGDVLCCSSRTETIYLLPDEDGDGVADRRVIFARERDGLNLPFGMAFADGSFYVGNTDAVVRYAYQPESRSLNGSPETITELPGRGYRQHWTRNVIVSPDGTQLFVSVGSRSNVSVEPLPRASILRMRLDGSEREVYASGLRNPVGLDFQPQTGELYTTVNERDGLGDNLVPDYLARVVEGAFYGWPYAYITPEHLDPRRMDDGESERPDLAAQTRTPEVLFESHSAALGLAFYDAEMFPARYRGGAFAAFRGSWNRSRGTGYKIVFIPFDNAGKPRGHYEDFVRGFLIDPAGPTTWARPVGVVVASDGSLLFTDEGNGRVYRVSYEAPEEQQSD